MPRNPKIILDLCGGTGSWSLPYKMNGYSVLIVDPKNLTSYTYPHSVEEFVLDMEASPLEVHGILAAPPCTYFASSGARWWAKRDSETLLPAVETVRACLRVVHLLQPVWWALENPIGRIQQCVPELGPPKLRFDPWEFGDPYTKKTHVWGEFTIPERNAITPSMGSAVIKMSPSEERQQERSRTPWGFAYAFFKANP